MGALQELRKQFQQEDERHNKEALQKRATEETHLTPDEWDLIRSQADPRAFDSGQFGENGSLRTSQGSSNGGKLPGSKQGAL